MDHSYRWIKLNDRGGVDTLRRAELGAVRVLCRNLDLTTQPCAGCGSRHSMLVGRLAEKVLISFCSRCGEFREADADLAWESYARSVEILDEARERGEREARGAQDAYAARAALSPPAIEVAAHGEETESKLMIKIKEVGSVLKSNGKSAAWRTAAKKSARAARAPIVAALEALTGDSVLAKSLAKFMATDNGLALTGVFVGAIPLLVPEVSNDPNILRLAEEMRIGGMEIVTDKVGDKLFAPVMGIFSVGLASLKAAGATLPESVPETVDASAPAPAAE